MDNEGLLRPGSRSGGETCVLPRTLSSLEAAFEESDLPFAVDIVDVSRIGERFRQMVAEQRVPLPLTGSRNISGRRTGSGDEDSGIDITVSSYLDAADGWIYCTLADACSSVDYGLTASASRDSSGPRFLRITDIVSGHLDWNNVPYAKVDNATAKKYELHNGDIVIARTGASTGASMYIKEPPPAVFASYLVRLQAKSEFDSRFLAYYLKSPLFWQFIRGVLGDKSAQPNASASTMSAAPLHAPKDKSEQRAIAHILATLDDKIELNRRMNETLEAMARALFKSWFVDFDPVRAKMEGRDPNLPQHLADLFPDRLVDSELGEIPEGWTVRRLGEVAVQRRSGAKPGEIDPDTPYIALEHMPKRCIALSEWDTADGLASSKFRFEQGDILFGKLRPYFHKVGVAALDGVCSTDIVVVSPASPDWFGFVLFHISSPEFVDYTDAVSTGTRMPRTKWTDMARFKIAMPNRELTKTFTGLVQPWVNRIASAIHESRTLAAQRDALLPKLISGQIRIRHAQIKQLVDRT